MRNYSLPLTKHLYAKSVEINYKKPRSTVLDNMKAYYLFSKREYVPKHPQLLGYPGTTITTQTDLMP